MISYSRSDIVVRNDPSGKFSLQILMRHLNLLSTVKLIKVESVKIDKLFNVAFAV